MHNLRILYNPIAKSSFNTFIDFLLPQIFGIMDHTIVIALINLRLDLAANNLQMSVFGFPSNVSENQRSDFLVLGCFTGKNVPDYIGIFQ